jgi:hypothetical protein
MEHADKRPESRVGDEIATSTMSFVTPGHRKRRATLCPRKTEAALATVLPLILHKLKPGKRGTHDIGGARRKRVR